MLVKELTKFHPENSLLKGLYFQILGRILRCRTRHTDQRTSEYWNFEGLLYELAHFVDLPSRDRLCFREARTRSIIEKLPKFPKMIVETGCGNARTCFYLSRYLAPVDYQGFDQSENLVRWARAINRPMQGQSVCFWTGDITERSAFEQVDLSKRPLLVLVNDVFAYLNPEQCRRGLENLVRLGADYMILHQSLGNCDFENVDSHERERGKWVHNLPRKLREMDANYRVIGKDFDLRYDAQGSVVQRMGVAVTLEKTENDGSLLKG